MMKQNTTLATPVTRVAEAARIKRMAATASYVGLSRATVYRLIKSGDFPAPVKLGRNAVGWDVRDLDAYIDAKKNQRATH